MAEVKSPDQLMVSSWAQWTWRPVASRPQPPYPPLACQIIQLEKQHGFHLFIRDRGTAPQLTKAGCTLVQEARSAILHVDRAIYLSPVRPIMATTMRFTKGTKIRSPDVRGANRETRCEVTKPEVSQWRENKVPTSAPGYRLRMNPRFPPTIRVSLTTSQALRRPPEVT